MIFKPGMKHEVSTYSTRKEAAFQRKLKREQDSLPLLADLVAAEQHDWESEKANRDISNRRFVQSVRDLDASHWRKGRAIYFSLPTDVRAACRVAWKNWRGPLDPRCFIYVVESFSGEGERREKAIRQRNAEHRARIDELVAAELTQISLLCA